MSTEHDERMFELFANRSMMELKFDIVKLTRENLANKLRQKRCNPNDDIEIFCKRLLQSVLKETGKYKNLVP